MKKIFLTASVLAFLAGVMTVGFAPAPAYAAGKKKEVVCEEIKDAKKQAKCEKAKAAKMKKAAAKMKKGEKKPK